MGLFCERLAPICFCPFFFFFSVAGGHRRLGETLHLVREEILLRPLLLLLPLCGSSGTVGGFNRPTLRSPPSCSLCFSNHAADVPDG